MNENVKVIDRNFVLELLPKREQDSHKGTFGSVLNIAGSTQFTGAAYLSSVSSLKVGAGYCTLASCSDVIETISATTPDITFANAQYSTIGYSKTNPDPADTGKERRGRCRSCLCGW